MRSIRVVAVTADSLFARTLLPVVDADDARASVRGLRPHLRDGDRVRLVNVVEKAGGAPDKTPVEQSESIAAAAFEAARGGLARGPADVAVETDVRYARDVADAVFESAAEFDATCVAFTPREGSRWVRLLTGDVALSLVTESDRPVVVLPDRDDGGRGDE